MPVFSVVVPVYGVEEYLDRCVESILSQTFNDFELVLVDDGSPDNCPAMCDRYAEKDSRVKVIHKVNGGLCSARNAGLAIAAGEYIVPVDSDDWIDRDALQLLWDKAVRQHHPDAIIFNALKVFDDHNEEIPYAYKAGYYSREKMLSDILPYMIWDRRQGFCKGLFNPAPWNKVYKREILLEHHCFDERIRMGEDNAYVFEALYYSKSLVMLDDYLYFYYQGNSESISTAYDANRFRNNKILIDYLQKRLGGLEPWLDEELNAFKAYWLFMAIFHEARSGHNFVQGCKHIKHEISLNKSTCDIDSLLLPRSARAFLALINSKCYPLVLLAAKLGVALKG